MLAPSNARGLTLLVCCNLLLLCPAVVAQDGRSGGGGIHKDVFDIEREQRQQRQGTPQYVVVDLPEKKLRQYYPELKGLVPAQSQQDLPALLEKVGASQGHFVDSIPNVCATEDVVQENLDKHGWVQGAPVYSERFNYLFRTHAKGQGMSLTEGRANDHWQMVNPHAPSGYSLAGEFVLFPLNFHPFHQGNANFRYLGRQVVGKQEDYVVAFAQQPEKSQLLGAINVNGNEIVVAFQGIAWIDPDSSQIVRMRIDYLKARPEVGTQSIDTNFSEVRLPMVAQSFWMPRDVVVTRSVGEGSLRETHKFSDYKIFTKSEDQTATQSGAEKPK